LRRPIFKDNQINGKRSIRLNNHANSGARRVSDTSDPFVTPTADRVPRSWTVLPL
jgi:hypothetical protein